MNKTKVGIVGCGSIGENVASFIDSELKDNVILWAVADREEEKATCLSSKCRTKPLVTDTDSLIKEVDLVLETASIEAARYILKKACAYKKDVVVLSVGAFMAEPGIIKKARKAGIKIYIPSGAVCGIDGLSSLSLGKINKVSLVTSKPPAGLVGVEYLKKRKINVLGLKQPKIVFRGSVKDAVKYFPQNINVAATLFLAADFAPVQVCISADPSLKRNVHAIEIDAQDAHVNIKVENVPSDSNPKTSALAALSTRNLLRKMFASLRVGS